MTDADQHDLHAQYRRAVEMRRTSAETQRAAFRALGLAERNEAAARRALVLSVECPYCHVQPGERCDHGRTDWGATIDAWPTHGTRNTAAGVL